jgi:hypothetical protein
MTLIRRHSYKKNSVDTIAANEPYLWLKASEVATIDKDANKVSNWASVLPATYALSETTNKPTYNAGGYVTFNKDNSEQLINNTMASSKYYGKEVPLSFAVVFSPGVVDTSMVLFSIGLVNPFSQFSGVSLQYISSQQKYRFFAADIIGRNYTVYLGSATINTYCIVVVSITGLVIDIYFNGVKYVDGISFLHSFDSEAEINSDRFLLGGRIEDPDDSFFSGNLKEIALFDTAISSNDALAICNELNATHSIY